MSVHENFLGSANKQQALDALAAFYLQHGWTHDASTDRFVGFEAPANATPEEIAEVSRGAELILAAYGLGVH